MLTSAALLRARSAIGAAVRPCVLLMATMACACASAPPPAAAPPQEPAAAPAPESQATSAAPMDLDATSAELDRAETDLQRALAVAGTPGATPAPQKKSADKETELSGGGGDPCQSACSALGSMERSAAHLCGLTSEADSRCQAAKARVTRAGERVRSSCPACAR